MGIWTFYKNYLRRAPDAPNCGEVERRIQELETEQHAIQKRKAEEERHAKAAAEGQAAKIAESAAPVPPPVATPSPQPVLAPLSRPSPEVIVWPVVPAPANRVDLTQATSSKRASEAVGETSILHSWWFWSAVGVVVVGGGVTAVLLATRGNGNGPFCSDCARTAGVDLK